MRGELLKTWIDFSYKKTNWYKSPCLDTVYDDKLASIVDGGKWMETMTDYGMSVRTGRATIHGQTFAIISSNPNSTSRIIPAGDLLI